MSITSNGLAAAEEGIRESLRIVTRAYNEHDPELYIRATTEDLLNMTVQEVGGRDVIATFDRSARLEELAEKWANPAFEGSATVEPNEIYVAQDRAFAIFDVNQTFTPKPGQPGKIIDRFLQLYLFLKDEPGVGWKTERSMTIVRSSTERETAPAK